MTKRSPRPRAGHGTATVQLPPRPEVPEAGPAWLAKKRRAAWKRLESVGLPDRKHPRWRTFDPRPMLSAAVVSRGKADADTFAVDGLPHRIVLVDGHFDAKQSTAPEGLRILPLASDDEVVRYHLDAAAADDEHDAATLLNMAGWQEGVLLDVQPGADVKVHLLHVQTAVGLTLPRMLVHVQDGAKLTLFQEFSGAAGAVAVTELHAHTGATIRRDLFQDAEVLHTTLSKAERGATIRDVQVHLRSGRNTSVARLVEAGAHVELAGLYLAARRVRCDHWTRIDHAVPHTTSREVYKGILAGEARAAFTGNVLVREGAQKTSAEQENRNLLLSRKALAESTPQLEIHADDVQCSHGSTVGQLDEDALFFLQSRGIGRAEAQAMLTKAFAGEIVDMLVVPPVREAVLARIEAWFRDAEVS